MLLTTRWVEARVFTKRFVPAGVVLAKSGHGQEVSFTPEHNGVGTGSITLPTDHKLVVPLLTPGARVQFFYRDSNPDLDPVDKMSGPVVASNAGLSHLGSVITFTVVSDDVLLRSLAWPAPLLALSSQPEYYTNTGGIDLVVFEMIRDNLRDRLGLPVTMVTFFPSGPIVTVRARFQPMVEVLKPALEEAGRGVRFWQWNLGDPVPFFLTGLLDRPTVLCEVYTTTDRPYVQWTSLQGITEGTASTSAPSATRVIVGGQGEGAARSFTSHIDATREADWGPLGIREVFVDARDAADAATIEQRAKEALTEGAATASLSTTTVDGEPWTVGHHYNLGDRVRIAAVTGEVIATRVVRAITYSSTADEGVRVRPQIGDKSPTDDPDEWLAKTVRSLGGRLTSLEARR